MALGALEVRGPAADGGGPLALLAYGVNRQPLSRVLVARVGLLATGVVVLPLALFLFNPTLLGILVLWSLGLSLFLPFPLYLLSLWCFAFAVLRALGRGGSRRYGLGLICLPLAGYVMLSSLQPLTALLALILLTSEEPLPS